MRIYYSYILAFATLPFGESATQTKTVDVSIGDSASYTTCLRGVKHEVNLEKNNDILFQSQPRTRAELGLVEGKHSYTTVYDDGRDTIRAEFTIKKIESSDAGIYTLSNLSANRYEVLDTFKLAVRSDPQRGPIHHEYTYNGGNVKACSTSVDNIINEDELVCNVTYRFTEFLDLDFLSRASRVVSRGAGEGRQFITIVPATEADLMELKQLGGQCLFAPASNRVSTMTGSMTARTTTKTYTLSASGIVHGAGWSWFVCILVYIVSELNVWL